MSDEDPNAVTERDDYINSVVDSATNSNQERDSEAAQGIKGVKASDNPYKPGKALYRAWERKRQEGTLQAQQ